MTSAPALVAPTTAPAAAPLTSPCATSTIASLAFAKMPFEDELPDERFAAGLRLEPVDFLEELLLDVLLFLAAGLDFDVDELPDRFADEVFFDAADLVDFDFDAEPVFFADDFLAVAGFFFADDFDAVEVFFFAVVDEDDFAFVAFAGLRAVVVFFFDADLAPVDFDFAAAIKNASYE